MGGNLVAIVGRPNVGKSTLFNRLTESRKAIVDEMEGVTRDRHYGYAEWNGIEFSVVDTGGYVHGSDDVFEDEIRKQVDIAVEEADVILFVVDITTGSTDLDITTANMLRKSGKPVFVVANKVDNHQLLGDISEFYSFGLGEIYGLSAINGGGTGELLDDLVKKLPEKKIEKLDLPKIAIIGQPNVGKSSLSNTLVGYERTIVTPIAGTTRDTINTRYTAFGHDFFLVDTAGLRKKAKVKEDVEFYSVMRTIRALEDADVCLLMIDATTGGLGAQDMSIVHLVQKNKKGLVILVNKWDLVEKDHNSMKLFTEEIKNKIAPFTDVPIIFTSVTTKQRIFKALETAIEVYENRTRKISTSQLNKILLPIIEAYPPPSLKGKNVKIKYITQLPTFTPSFAFFCNLPQYIKDPYKRFLENKMRENFQLTGVPISVLFRSKDGD